MVQVFAPDEDTPPNFQDGQASVSSSPPEPRPRKMAVPNRLTDVQNFLSGRRGGRSGFCVEQSRESFGDLL